MGLLAGFTQGTRRASDALIVGYLWLFSGWLLAADEVKDIGVEANASEIERLTRDAWESIGSAPRAFVVSSMALALGSLAIDLTGLFKRHELPMGRGWRSFVSETATVFDESTNTNTSAVHQLDSYGIEAAHRSREALLRSEATRSHALLGLLPVVMATVWVDRLDYSSVIAVTLWAVIRLQLTAVRVHLDVLVTPPPHRPSNG